MCSNGSFLSPFFQSRVTGNTSPSQKHRQTTVPVARHTKDTGNLHVGPKGAPRSGLWETRMRCEEQVNRAGRRQWLRSGSGSVFASSCAFSCAAGLKQRDQTMGRPTKPPNPPDLHLSRPPGKFFELPQAGEI
ncbi:uncharacterized protein LOC144915404 [Branchiostoma floridae x Branchiostoma belcheri]